MRRPLGVLDLTETGRSGYLRLRASITFALPTDLEPGTYHFDYCNEPCDKRLGDLIGDTVHVGASTLAPTKSHPNRTKASRQPSVRWVP